MKRRSMVLFLSLSPIACNESPVDSRPSTLPSQFPYVEMNAAPDSKLVRRFGVYLDDGKLILVIGESADQVERHRAELDEATLEDGRTRLTEANADRIIGEGTSGGDVMLSARWPSNSDRDPVEGLGRFNFKGVDGDAKALLDYLNEVISSFFPELIDMWEETANDANGAAGGVGGAP